MPTGGELIVRCLERQGVERVFCVPGESYLPVLDALRDSPIDVVVARQEGGAAMMAEADGKLTGRPGVCLVTRGPGATNAAAGVHVAKQDSTPMLLLVGQIGRGMRGREAFQEVDYRQTFRDLAKWVEEIDQPERIPEILSHAVSVALSGRPGPVVLSLPEDMLRETAEATAGPRVAAPEPAPAPADAARAAGMLAQAERPIVVAGGSRWDAEAVAALRRFAASWDVPVGCSFRRQGLFDHLDPAYAGDVGLGINPKLRARIAESDLLLLLGARFSENPSQDFSLLGIPDPGKPVIHVHPGPEELGRIYAAALPICATPGAFLAALAEHAPASAPRGRAEAAHADYRAWSEPRAGGGGAGVDLGAVVAHLREAAPEAIVTNGAGNYAIWLHRFWRWRDPQGQVAPTSGSMGYGLPAAVAVALRRPDRLVLCFAGDGCLQMTLQELGTLAERGARVVVLVADNGGYGTIRMHQERRYPGRVSATGIRNPDFAALARAYGLHAETVTRTDAFPNAFARARESGGPALLHLLTDMEAITPATTLSALRARSG